MQLAHAHIVGENMKLRAALREIAASKASGQVQLIALAALKETP